MTARVPLAVLCRATPPALGRRRPSPPLLAPASRALGEVQRCADPGAEPRADRLGGRGLRRAAGARRAERGSPRCGEGSSHRKEWLRPGRPLRSLQAVSGAICSPAWHPKRLGARVCVCVCVCACARARARSPCSHSAERRPGGPWAGGFQDVSQVFKRSPSVWSLHCGCALVKR